MSHKQEAVREWARNYGAENRDRAWLISDYDTWEPNPFYVGPPVRHPEEDPEDDEPNALGWAAPELPF